jgi:serine/threonine protein phosphatase PrpC
MYSMLTFRGLIFQSNPRQGSDEKKLPMRWLEKLHLDSPAHPQLTRLVSSGAAEPGTSGCTSRFDGRRLPTPGIQISAQSARGQRHTGQASDECYLLITGARRAQRQLQPFGLMALADSAGGQHASRITIHMLFECLVSALIEEELNENEAASLLQDAIHSANQRLYRQNQRDQTSMGCTIIAALVTNQEACICNVGNSRAYMLSEQARIRQKTVDHTIGEGLVAAGILTREDAAALPSCGRTYRRLGQDWWVQIDTFRQALVSGDQLLLCSDGLWQRLDASTIESTLRVFPQLSEASSKLLRIAQEHGGSDDITAMLCRLTGEARCPGQPGIEQIASNQPLPLRRGFVLAR